MLEKLDARLLMYVLFFPTYFQEDMMRWAWGAEDDVLLMIAKRIFLLLPCAAIVMCCWVTIACLLSVIVRHQRRQFMSTLLITWWDLGRAIFSFWGGFFKFCFYLAGWVLGLFRLAILTLWLAIQDILLTPLRAIKGVTDIAAKPGTPWIAVWITLAWCALEAGILTIMMTYTTTEILSNVTQGVEFEESVIQIVLFTMLIFLIIGSYALLSTVEEALSKRDFRMIGLLVVVEIAAWAFEVLFLWREFVDALVPWFAQYMGEDFNMGLFGILGIATIAWAGVRGFTWFTFAAHGTPTIMAIIQRSGLKDSGGKPLISFKKDQHFTFIKTALDKVKQDMNWVHNKGDEIVSAFILPPLQIVAASINFCTMLISGKHLFQLPFKSYKDMLHADHLISRIKERES